MLAGMIGRKLGMMNLYDGGGRRRACTVIELGPNRVTQIRSPERDGYEAVQLGFTGARKRNNRPERGHLGRAGIEEPLTRLREFTATEISDYQLGQTITVDQFEAGQYVNVTGVSKGRGFAGAVKRWHFAGGPKTHGQSDRHRAPGSVGAGTTPGKTWRGQKMAGHMGAEQKTVLNVLVVAVDPSRNLIFVEGSAPGPRDGLLTVTHARRSALAEYQPPELPGAAAEPEPEPEIEATPEPEVVEVTAEVEAAPEASVEEAADEAPADEMAAEPEADEDADEAKSEASE